MGIYMGVEEPKKIVWDNDEIISVLSKIVEELKFGEKVYFTPMTTRLLDTGIDFSNLRTQADKLSEIFEWIINWIKLNN